MSDIEEKEDYVIWLECTLTYGEIRAILSEIAFILNQYN